MDTHSGFGSGNYGPDEQRDPAAAVLKALRDYRAAEVATRRSTRDSTGMGETDLIALRYLLRAQAAGEQVGPKDLSRVLQITTASTTSLIDRLVSSGHVRREPHPTDRRSLVVVPTVAVDSEVRATLGALHHKMMAVAEELSAAEARIIISFLRRMGQAVSGPGSG
ncbi:MAG: MarR family transcriptional regulator [Arthrobacter sp.]|jgi:DNA-binding MarR family transcriptional regulator|nr:MarR family transcriptional regulator [Arthrobacter sp.]MCU1540200.1 MarR family transcriptional regulator [Arthrobacter sp.]MCU1552748.1 MarR family transcriptional regulator [Arthrobacter sp.]